MRTPQILRGRTSFERVFRSGRRVEGRLFRFYFHLQSASQSGICVGYAVPARSLPAVRRNRVRRLMREAFRAEGAVLESWLQGRRELLEAVLVYRPTEAVDARRLALGEVRSDLARMLRRVCERV